MNAQQLALEIIPRLSYSRENFVMHAGVRPWFSDLKRVCCSPGFSCMVVKGPTRSGKTHLAVTLTESLAQEQFYPHLTDAATILERGMNATENWFVGTAPVLIVDDSFKLFESCLQNGSGRFVELVEHLRVRQGKLVLLVGEQPAIGACDEHVQSRITAGVWFEIGKPSDDEVLSILDSMARQRGIKLSSRKVKFLRARVGRSIPELERYLNRAIHLARVLGRSFELKLLSDAVRG